MINADLHQLIGKLSSYGIIISFNGSFTQGIIEEIGTAITSYLQEEKGTDETDIHNVFSVYIEQAQNIKRYFRRQAVNDASRDLIRRAFESIIVIGRQEDRFFVCSGNLVRKDDVDGLRQRLDHVNSLSKEQLKQYYKETLRQKSPPGDNAGLGIIDMARKAAVPLEYLFMPRDEEHAFFTLKVTCK
ncbi:MAG: SiaB family protein kinase [Sporomusaceae bacterium]|nr:SiaB family protein kinase [Sporomusaceae bacterium]